MKSKNLINFFVAVSITVFTVIILSGCAASTNLWGDPDTGLILSYRMEKDKPMTYQMTNSMNQELEMMGNKVETSMNTVYSYTFMNKDDAGKNLNLEFKINDMTMEIKSPQGNLNPDLSPVKGKVFEMMISKLGKELSFKNLDEIKYEIRPGQDRGITSDFKVLFPNLADRPLKIGDTWTSYDTLITDDGGVNLNLVFEMLNTYQGIETVNGVECAKITADSKGTMSGSGTQGGMSFTMNGTSTGNDTWFFDYKSGILVNLHSTADTDAEIKATNMTIPMKMKMTIDNVLQ